MRRFNFLNLIFAIFFLTTFISSCSEDEVEFNTQESNTYESEENLEAVFDLVSSITNEGMIQVESNDEMGRIAQSSGILTMATVTFSGDKESGRVEIDFGTTGVTGPDGRTWKGVVVLEYDGRRYIPGSVVYTVFEDFYIDEYKIEGSRVSTNITENINQPKFQVVVTNGKLTWPGEEGLVATWSCNRTHTWTINQDFSFSLSIQGTANGVNTLGQEYSTLIYEIDPLILKSECISSSAFIPVQGSKTISSVEDLQIDVYYGAGTCDRTVMIKIGKQTKEVHF